MGKKRKSKGKKSTQPPQNSKAESTKNNEVEMNLENKEHKGSNLPPPDKKVMPPMPTTSSESKIEDANTKIQVLSDEASCTDYLVSKDGEESWDNRTQEEKKNKDHQPKQYQIKGEMRNKQSSKVTDEHDGRQSRRGWNAEKPDKDWFKEDANSNIQSSAAASHINDLAFQTGEECWHGQNITKKNKDVNRRSNQYWAEGKTRDDKWRSSSNSVGDEKDSKQGGNSFKRNDRITHFSPNRNVDRVQDDEYNEYYGFAKKGRVQFIKVEEIESDLFAMPDEYALAHCVAEDMSMGSGIAVQFSQAFKGREQLFQQRQKQGGLAILEVKGRYIYYLVTKRLSNGKPTLYTLWCSLKKLQEHIKKFEVRKLAIPRIGCGLDRLDWSMVKPMIEYVFRDTNIQITVCNFQQEEEECRNEMQKKLPKSEPKCALRNVRYPVVDIEPECAIIYLGTEDGHVTDGMRRLDAKFHFLSEYTARRNKMGDVIQKWSFDRMYALYGFIVRTSANAELDFVALGNCISEMNRKNSKRDQFYYAGLEAFDDKDDNLLLTKVVNLLRHSLRKNVEVYVCWPNELQHLMPQTNSYY